jgi:hypothetical protein
MFVWIALATAGEAHWQLGRVERTIATLFNSATRIQSSTHCTMRQAVAIATQAHSEVDRVNGFTPTQWCLGRNPTWTGELHDEPEDRVNIARDAQEQFAA